MTELSGYAFAPLREGDIALFRGYGNGLSPILLAAVEETSIDCAERLEHEYALKGELDADWAAQPIALTRYKDRLTLVLEDPGGASLDQLLGRPLEVSHFLRMAIPLTGALRHVHERGLIHKDIKPANILVDTASGGAGNPFFAIQFLIALTDEGLLAFDPLAAAWQWNIDSIRARSYTDNVVDLMAGKLKRLSPITQEALKQLACLGNVAPTATLALVYGTTEQAMRAVLWEAVRAELVLYQESTIRFLHDRIQQAVYSLVPEAQRADIHLRIGRVLLAGMTADDLAEHLFDVANQLNRGAALLIDPDEKAQVAKIDLRAGRKAKASAAYASARTYFTAGMALLDKRDWDGRYELMFSLWLDRAACEYLSGNYDEAEELISELLARGASIIDKAAAYRLKIDLYVARSDYPQAVDSALTGLKLFGVDLPAHPTWEQVQAEYETVWRNLDGCPIESLINLPLMTDPELHAAMLIFSVLFNPAHATDFNLFYLQVCRMVNISLEHGMSGASASAYARFGQGPGAAFHRYQEGYRFAKLACDLVEKHSFFADQAKVYYVMGMVATWTQPSATAIDFERMALRSAIEAGDLSYACHSTYQTVGILLLRNDPLDAVWRESERCLDLVRKARFREVTDIIVSQQRFVVAMQGRTATFSTFSDAQFDEQAFEADLTANRMAMTICLYWILKLKARFLSGDYVEALVAAGKARALLRATTVHVQQLDYFYYTALTVAALYEKGSADEQSGWRDLLKAHGKRLQEWADNYPPTFADKYTLVSAEIARLEGRDVDAMRLYGNAIRSAREHGFVQNEGLAHELAGRFFTAHGFDTVARTCLREARSCYLRWGAFGKVRQLEQLHPNLPETSAPASPTATIGRPVEQLDVGTVLKAAQAVSGEIELGDLIKVLLRIAVEHAGADRGLLILFAGHEPRIAAEATTGSGRTKVTLRQTSVSPAELAESVLRFVIRTRESVILDDALTQNPFSADQHICQKRTRSVLCLPLVKQVKLIGVLYLENNLASHVFTPARMSVLEVLATQAAISLENARLYSDLQEREAKIRRLVDSNIVGIVIWDVQGRIIDANQAFLDMVGYGREDLVSGPLRWTELTPPEWRDADEQIIAELKAVGTLQPREKEYLRKDGGRVPVLVARAMFESSQDEGVAFVLDLTERKQVEEALRDAQANLAHVARVTTLGELAASIAHEVNQPLAGVIANAAACLRWLDRKTPDLNAARRSVEWIIDDGNRASEVIRRLRTLAKKASLENVPLDVNDVVRETIPLVQRELTSHRVSLRMDLAAALPTILGDRVQLQQVIINLVMNGIEAMQSVKDRPRELVVRSGQDERGQALISVADCGVGIPAENAGRLFNPFFTTKSSGMGMGLSICRSIMEAHGGKLWATANVPFGAMFEFTLPVHAEIVWDGHT
jgi:PAS domain S-box-containing protein